MAHILLVLSASDHWTLSDGDRHPTGYWAEEFIVPHRTFRERGVQITVATPGARTPSVDEASLSADMNGGDEDKVADMRRYIESVQDELASPARLEDMAGRIGEFDAVYIPGGHGPMEDLAANDALGRVLSELHAAGKVVAAMCHGPAGLFSARRPDGGWLFEGRQVTGFSDDEERQVGLADRAPWLLEDRLRREGGRYQSGPAWASFVVTDGNLITGQNPASSQAATDRTLEALGVTA